MSVYQQRTRTKRLHVGTSATAIYVADTQSIGTQLVSFFACNKSAADVTLTVEVYDASSASSFFLASEAPIPANETFYTELEGYSLGKNDEVRIAASVDDAVDAHLTLTERAARSQ